jgi:hypothetical protein
VEPGSDTWVFRVWRWRIQQLLSDAGILPEVSGECIPEETGEDKSHTIETL